MELKKYIFKKMIQNKTNSNKKNEDQIWHKNKLKLNVKEWNWKQNSIKKRIKKKDNQNNENQIWYKN